ncbi:hypothetical protein DSM3645_18441 [Blastopirellula marina DSM 3645]|uniref:DUF1559 domain-containing protein n=1 Tax=Blastopirellula marina DSM 3645 TaxID=314230 RepID=A3ZYX8_9BACT|nr:hypothetical protein DSM3645_18441 [Blastopirellula marina DSM 3645]
MVLPAFLGCGNSPAQWTNHNKLETIAFAIGVYRDIFKEYPPIVVTNDAEESLHSWRVLILPQIEANNFYDQYDFETAWNGERNIDLRDGTRRMDSDEPNELVNAGRVYLPDDSPRMQETVFVALVNGQLREKEVRLPSVTQTGHYLPPGEPFVVLEIKHSGIHWMEPRDVTPPMDRYPDWPSVDEVRDQIVGSVEIGDGDTRIFRDRTATLTYLESLTKME